jgi:hypothetical protein
MPRPAISWYDVQDVEYETVPAKFKTPEQYSDPTLQDEFSEWCRAEGIFYYARPREDFSTQEAYRLAAAEGLSRVLMEDLS